MKKISFCIMLVVAIVMTITPVSYAAQTVRLYGDLSNVPREIVGPLNEALAERIAALGTFEVVDTPTKAHVIMIIVGVPIITDGNVDGYVLSVTKLFLEDPTGKVFLFSLPDILLLGISDVKVAANEIAKDLNVYLDDLVKMGRMIR